MTAKKDFTILYGSQTGQAQAISEEIFDRSFKEGFNPVRFCLSQVEKKFSIEKETCVVFVCSTTGEGEPPDTALKFFRRIKKKTLSSRHLHTLSFAVLGLGDSNYTNFCNCPKAITKRLFELGASEFYDCGYGDDAVGLEEVVEPWIDGLFPALRKHLNQSYILDVNGGTDLIIENTNMDLNEKRTDDSIKSNTAPSLKSSIPPLSTSALKVPSSPDAFLKINYINNVELSDQLSIECPAAATEVKEVFIKSARQLTFDADVKKALEIELDTSLFDFEFEPGDSFGIVCENKKGEVEYILERLGIVNVADKLINFDIIENTKKKAPSVPQHIHCPSTIRTILSKYVDFRTVPRKAFFRMLVDYTEKEGEKRRLQELCSTQGTKDYTTYVREQCVGLIQILRTFPSCLPPIERILEMLPHLLPREYSIASYTERDQKSLKFVFNVIELPIFQENKRFGLCTSWLDSITENMRNLSDGMEEKMKTITLNENKLSLYFRRPSPFRFPKDPSKPLIMIGPGTGVAPFIGFLQKRNYLKLKQPTVELGKAVLFFGCRYSEKDFLYKDELQTFKESGILTDLFTCFSREQISDEFHLKYVQDNVKLQKNMVLDLLFEKDGAVFICGDAKHMGRDVTNTFVELIEEYKSLSKLDAIKLLNELRQNEQFLEDVWT